MSNKSKNLKDEKKVPTVQQMEECLKVRILKGENAILLNFVNCGSSSTEMSADQVFAAFHEIIAKIPFVQAGVIEFSASEKMLYQLFMIHAGH